jgi:hypothetical protein
VNATASSQTGCSGWAPAPELCPYGAPAAATSPPAFMNKPQPFPSSYLTSFLLNLTHTTSGLSCCPPTTLATSEGERVAFIAETHRIAVRFDDRYAQAGHAVFFSIFVSAAAISGAWLEGPSFLGRCPGSYWSRANGAHKPKRI